MWIFCFEKIIIKDEKFKKYLENIDEHEWLFLSMII